MIVTVGTQPPRPHVTSAKIVGRIPAARRSEGDALRYDSFLRTPPFSFFSWTLIASPAGEIEAVRAGRAPDISPTSLRA